MVLIVLMQQKLAFAFRSSRVPVGAEQRSEQASKEPTAGDLRQNEVKLNVQLQIARVVVIIGFPDHNGGFLDNVAELSMSASVA